jgi:hypothetical protein
MVGAAAIVGGAALIGTVGSMYAADKAAGAQKRAARDAAAATSEAAQQSIDAQERMFGKQVELQEPFRQAGLSAQNRLMDYLALSENKTAPGYGKYARDFSLADYTADPGYGFRVSEGMKALERSAAARGGLLSGSTLKGITRFGQGTASEEYQNAFNRYQVNRANQLNPLQSLMGSGQTSANALTSAAGQTGAGMGSTYMGMGAGLSNAALAGGQARASGYSNMASTLNQGLSTGANLYMQSQYLGGVNELNKARTAYYQGGGGLYGPPVPPGYTLQPPVA